MKYVRFSVGYNANDKFEIMNIHKDIMVKNDIKCFALNKYLLHYQLLANSYQQSVCHQGGIKLVSAIFYQNFISH